MQDIIKKLRAFHTKQRFTLDADLCDCEDVQTTNWLFDVAADLQLMATDLEKRCGGRCDTRLHRVQLMVEELGESIEAMAHNDEVALVDGLSDLLFVAIGTSEAFGLPTEQGLNEVCNSNLTKDPRAEADHRLRSKGPNYRPPDIKGVLETWRACDDGVERCD